MSVFRPPVQTQLPDSKCIIAGRHLGGENCAASLRAADFAVSL